MIHPWSIGLPVPHPRHSGTGIRHRTMLIAMAMLSHAGCFAPADIAQEESGGTSPSTTSTIPTTFDPSLTGSTTSLTSPLTGDSSSCGTVSDEQCEEESTDAPTSVAGDSETDDSITDGTEAESIDSTGASDADCGNGLVDSGEDCDGSDLNDGSCIAAGFDDGTLSCTNDCEFAYDDCVAVPPEAPVLSLDLSSIKQFDFTWDAVERATSYRLEESANASAPFTTVADNITATAFSTTVPLHLRAHARYRLAACTAAEVCGISEPVEVTGHLEEAIGYLKAFNPQGGNLFGGNVALSADGRTIAVSAITEGFYTGAVYIFVRDEQSWNPQASIRASNAEEGDFFGASLALSADGGTLVVGAYGEASTATGVGGDENNNSLFGNGAVYVFVRTGVSWSQQAYVKGNSGQPDEFGDSIALSEDGNLLAVGAPRADSGDLVDAGAVHMFDRDGSRWSPHFVLTASNAEANDRLGSSVALSADGETLAAGAVRGPNAGGAVYVFTRGGDSWHERAYLVGDNTEDNDNFGTTVALSADGTVLAAGADGEGSAAIGIDGNGFSNAASGSGAAYIFAWDRDDQDWVQTTYIKSSNTGSGDSFGRSVSLSSDGRTLAVGAWYEDSVSTGIDGPQDDDGVTSDTGAVYVFIQETSGWTQHSYVKASNTGDDDLFGASIALSADGFTLAVGASGEGSGSTSNLNDNSAYRAGAVYLY